MGRVKDPAAAFIQWILLFVAVATLAWLGFALYAFITCGEPPANPQPMP